MTSTFESSFSSNETKSSSNKNKSFEVPIHKGGGFFNDSIFQDSRGNYHDAIKGALRRWNTSGFNFSDEEKEGDDEFSSLIQKRKEKRQQERNERRKMFHNFFTCKNDSAEKQDTDRDDFFSKFNPKDNSKFFEDKSFKNKDGGSTRVQQSFQSYQSSKSSNSGSDPSKNIEDSTFSQQSTFENSNKEKMKEDFMKEFRDDEMFSKKREGFDDAWNNFDQETSETFKNIGKQNQTKTKETSFTSNVPFVVNTDDASAKISEKQSNWEKFTESVPIVTKKIEIKEEEEGNKKSCGSSNVSFNNFEDEFCSKTPKSRVKFNDDDEINEFVNDFSKYRIIRQQSQDENSCASNVMEEPQCHKILLDVHEYLDGEIKVRAVSETELKVECFAKMKEGEKTISLTFSKPYIFESPIDIPRITSALSSEGILTISVPKKKD